jgi:hypothetical protein
MDDWRFKTKLDPPGVAYQPWAGVREVAAGLDRSRASTGAVDRMLQDAVVYDQIGQSCCGEA